MKINALLAGLLFVGFGFASPAAVSETRIDYRMPVVAADMDVKTGKLMVRLTRGASSRLLASRSRLIILEVLDADGDVVFAQGVRQRRRLTYVSMDLPEQLARGGSIHVHTK